MSTKISTTTRRHFLQVLAASAAVPSLIACGSSGTGTPSGPVGDVAAGAVKDLSLGTLRAIPGASVAIGHDTMGIYAMTLTCTHAGCDIGAQGTVSGQGVACGCHGSRFNVNGEVVNGPAVSPLQHFAVSADAAGNLTIHGGTSVSAATRIKM